MQISRWILVWTWCFSSVSFGEGLSSTFHAPLKKTNSFRESGVIIGGMHQSELMLKGLRRSYDKKTKIERIVLDYGTSLKGKIERAGYFQVGLDNVLGKVIIDLQGMGKSEVSIDDLAKIFAKSQNFQKPVLVTSSADATVTLELKAKGKVAVEVFELSEPGKDARVVLDVKVPGQKGVKP